MRYRNCSDGAGISLIALGRWEEGDELEGLSVLRVAFQGEYGFGGQANNSARILRMGIAAALTWKHPTPAGLVIDVAGVGYFGGDTLVSWHSLLTLDNTDRLGFRVAFVCSVENLSAISSLLDECGDDWMEAFLLEDEALAFILGRSPLKDK